MKRQCLWIITGMSILLLLLIVGTGIVLRMWL